MAYQNPLQLDYRLTLNSFFQKNKAPLEISSDLLSFLPSRAFSENQSAVAEKSFSLSRDFEGVLSGMVKRYDPRTDTYLIEINRSLRVDSKAVHFRLQAQANRKDFIGRRILAEKLDGVRITFSSKSTSLRIFTEKDFLNLFEKETTQTERVLSPPSEEASSAEPSTSPSKSIELNDDVKRKLFLEWFNRLLNELF